MTATTRPGGDDAGFDGWLHQLRAICGAFEVRRAEERFVGQVESLESGPAGDRSYPLQRSCDLAR